MFLLLAFAISLFLAVYLSGVAERSPVSTPVRVNPPAVPEKLRLMRNIESGVNDGLALPLILTFLTRMDPVPPPTPWPSDGFRERASRARSQPMRPNDL